MFWLKAEQLEWLLSFCFLPWQHLAILLNTIKRNTTFPLGKLLWGWIKCFALSCLMHGISNINIHFPPVWTAAAQSLPTVKMCYLTNWDLWNFIMYIFRNNTQSSGCFKWLLGSTKTQQRLVIHVLLLIRRVWFWSLKIPWSSHFDRKCCQLCKWRRGELAGI